MCLCLPGACGRRRAAGAPQCLHVGCLGAPHARHRHDQRLRCTPCSALQRHITSASQHGHGTRVQDWCVHSACNRRQPPSDRPRRAPRALPHRAGRRTGRARLRSARHDRRSAVRRASQDGLLQARGEARVRIGARLANRGGQSARRGRRVIGSWVRRSGITCSRGGSAIRAARSTVEGVLHTARSSGLDQKVVGWVRSGRARFERSAAYLMRVGAAEVERRRRRTVDLHRRFAVLDGAQEQSVPTRSARAIRGRASV